MLPATARQPAQIIRLNAPINPAVPKKDAVTSLASVPTPAHPAGKMAIPALIVINVAAATVIITIFALILRVLIPPLPPPQPTR